MKSRQTNANTLFFLLAIITGGTATTLRRQTQAEDIEASFLRDIVIDKEYIMTLDEEGDRRSLLSTAGVWSPVISDETPPTDCSQVDRLSLVNRFEITGRGRPTVFNSWSKDNMRIQCSTSFRTTSALADFGTLSHIWTDFASEEHGSDVLRYCTNPLSNGGCSIQNLSYYSGQICPQNSFMTGIVCDGAYCDNVSIRCTQVDGRYWSASSRWTDWMSEGTFNLAHNEGIVGFACRGDYCAEMSFMVRRICECCSAGC